MTYTYDNVGYVADEPLIVSDVGVVPNGDAFTPPEYADEDYWGPHIKLDGVQTEPPE